MGSVAAAHLVQFYSGSEQLAESLTSIFAGPLLRGETVLVVATHDHRAALDGALADAGVNLAAEYRSGRYLPVDVDQALRTFMTPDGPDADSFRTGIGGTVEQARRRTGSVNAFGEMVGVLAERGDLATALALEALWDQVLRRHPLQLVCGYPREVVGDVSPAFDSICGLHDAVVVTRPAAEPTLSATLDLPLGPHAPATARRATRDVLAAWGTTDGPLADAGLVVTELVETAARAAADRVTLGLARVAGHVVVSVTDADSTRPSSISETDLAADGRSFALIGSVAEAWGVETLPDGTRVWARLRA
jgi:DcmR-like sensory protein